MDRRLAIVAVVGTLVGLAAGWAWLGPAPAPPPPPARASSAPAPPPPGPTRAADTGQPEPTAPLARPPGPRPPGERRPPSPGADDKRAQVVERTRTDEEPPPDTGLPDLPPPGENIGLPPRDLSDGERIAALAAEPPPLPDRPLSDVELKALEDQEGWARSACEGSTSPDCTQALDNLDAAIAAAHHRRKEAVLEEHGDNPPPLPPKPRPDRPGPVPAEDGW